jgi:hypothetical protein
VFRDKTLRAFFDGERLRSIPAKRRARVVVLLELLRRFESGRTYAEHEVNDLLRASHDDVASLRRELVDYRYLERADGRYWVTRPGSGAGRERDPGGASQRGGPADCDAGGRPWRAQRGSVRQGGERLGEDLMVALERRRPSSSGHMSAMLWKGVMRMPAVGDM